MTERGVRMSLPVEEVNWIFGEPKLFDQRVRLLTAALLDREPMTLDGRTFRVVVLEANVAALNIRAFIRDE